MEVSFRQSVQLAVKLMFGTNPGVDKVIAERSLKEVTTGQPKHLKLVVSGMAPKYVRLSEGKEPIEVREVQLMQVYAAVKVAGEPWFTKRGKLPHEARAEQPEQVALTKKVPSPPEVGKRLVRLGKGTKEVTAEQPVQVAVMLSVAGTGLKELNKVRPEKGLTESRLGQVVQVRDTVRRAEEVAGKEVTRGKRAM